MVECAYYLAFVADEVGSVVVVHCGVGQPRRVASFVRTFACLAISVAVERLSRACWMVGGTWVWSCFTCRGNGKGLVVVELHAVTRNGRVGDG